MIAYEYKLMNIDQLHPDPDNPRLLLKPGDPIFESLKTNINEFACLQPPVFNERTKLLIAGHQRVNVLKELGVKTTEVCCVNLPHDKAQQLGLGFNKITGLWDKPKLAIYFDRCGEIPDFGSRLIGFGPDEISQIKDRYSRSKSTDDIENDQLCADGVSAITKLGDMVEVGDHRILCGDAKDHNNYKKLFGNQKACLLDTDVPYGVTYTGNNRPVPGGGERKDGKWNCIQNDDLSLSEFGVFIKPILANVCDYLEPGACFYIWLGTRQIPLMYQTLLDFKFHVSCQVLWIKESASLSYGDYSFRSEQALYGFLSGAPHYFGGDPGETNIWEVKRENVRKYVHGNQKPVELRKRSVRNSSKRSQIVLDPMLGSGSIALACEALGRRCFGIEIEPKFCDAAIRRLIPIVGQDRVSLEVRKKYMSEEASGG